MIPLRRYLYPSIIPEKSRFLEDPGTQNYSYFWDNVQLTKLFNEGLFSDFVLVYITCHIDKIFKLVNEKKSPVFK